MARMEEDWGRRHDFVALEEATLTSMLQPVFPGKSVVSAQLLTEGHCNTNYKIRVSGLDDAFVLRLYIRDRTACQKDRDILGLVQERVPIAHLLYADTEHDVPYAVMKWVDGVLLSDILATGEVAEIADCAYAAGATLANIGTYTFPQGGFFGPGLVIAEPFNEDTTFLALIELFLFKGNGGQRLGKELTDRLWQFVTRNVDYLAAADGPARLVHSDYKGINLLMRQEDAGWQTAAVLDWEFAFAGSPLTDIGNMLRREYECPPVYASRFIQGYRENGGQLPEGWKKAAKLMDLISLCEFLNDPTSGEVRIRDVTGLIMGTLEHWDEFA